MWSCTISLLLASNPLKSNGVNKQSKRGLQEVDQPSCEVCYSIFVRLSWSSRAHKKCVCVFVGGVCVAPVWESCLTIVWEQWYFGGDVFLTHKLSSSLGIQTCPVLSCGQQAAVWLLPPPECWATTNNGIQMRLYQQYLTQEWSHIVYENKVMTSRWWPRSYIQEEWQSVQHRFSLLLFPKTSFLFL